MLAADGEQLGREVVRHRDEPALALHRLEHGACDRRRVELALEEQVEAGQGLVGRDAAVRVRRRRAIDLRREWPEALPVHELRRHGHGQERPAVEGVVEDEHGGPARRGTRDLDRVLDRLRARVDEQGLLLGARARRQLAEPAADLDVRLVEADHHALVQVAVDLLVDRSNHRRVAVAQILAADAACEVDVRAAVGVLELRALGARDDKRCGRNAARDPAAALAGDPCSLGPGGELGHVGLPATAAFCTARGRSSKVRIR